MKKTLPFNKETIEKIIQTIPTPFHIYDEEGIRKTAQDLNAAFSWNKGFREYFAVKALPNPYIMDILAQEGCGMDCSSETELTLAAACGFQGDKIMFSSNMTPPEEFTYARKLNSIINLDDITHIDTLAQNGGIPEVISCRFNPGGDFKIGNAVMGDPGEAKYGFTKPQLIEGFKKLLSLGAKKFGLHSFLASNTTDNSYYPALAKQLFELAIELNKLTGAKVEFVNLSGGIGIPYTEEQSKADIFKIGEAVRQEYEKIIAPTGMSLSVYAELGRFMTGPHGYLVTKAIHHKDIYKNYIGVDACAVNLMRPAMYGSYHHISVLGKEEQERTNMYDIVGSLCENNDKFAIDRYLPPVDMGDILVLHDTGAHGFSMGYNYNGKLRSAEVLLKKDGSFTQIRRAETPSDYFTTLDYKNLC